MRMCTCMCVIALLSLSKSGPLFDERLLLFLKQLPKKRIIRVFFFYLKFSCNLCMHRNEPLELSHNRNDESLHIRLHVSQTRPAMSCLLQLILVSLSFFWRTKHRCEKWGHAVLTVRPVVALGVAPTIYCSYAPLSFLGHHPNQFYMWGFFFSFRHVFRPHAVSRTELIPYLLPGSSECTNQEKHSLWKDYITFHHLLHWTL